MFNFGAHGFNVPMPHYAALSKLIFRNTYLICHNKNSKDLLQILGRKHKMIAGTPYRQSLYSKAGSISRVLGLASLPRSAECIHI